MDKFPSSTLFVCAIIQSPPKAVIVIEHRNRIPKEMSDVASPWRPVVISSIPSVRHLPVSEKHQKWLTQADRMENSRIYPPSLAMVSNPFMIETSMRAPAELEWGVSFFEEELLTNRSGGRMVWL